MRGAKSRYYPVELSDVLREIRARRAATRWSGSPASSRRSTCCARRTQSIRERVTHTLGLFCGHMKSAAHGRELRLAARRGNRAGSSASITGSRTSAGRRIGTAPISSSRTDRARRGLVASGRRRLGRRLLPESGMRLVRRRGCRDRGHVVRRRLGRAIFLRRPRHQRDDRAHQGAAPARSSRRAPTGGSSSSRSMPNSSSGPRPPG